MHRFPAFVPKLKQTFMNTIGSATALATDRTRFEIRFLVYRIDYSFDVVRVEAKIVCL
jgi:hypothetical protein